MKKAITRGVTRGIIIWTGAAIPFIVNEYAHLFVLKGIV